MLRALFLCLVLALSSQASAGIAVFEVKHLAYPGTFGGSPIKVTENPLVAQPPPSVAPAQINPIADRDYLIQLISERDRQYSQRFDAQERAVSSALAAASAAVAKAELAAEKRFESVNEFRGQLRDQQGTFLPRQEYTVQHAALIDVVEKLATRVEQIAQRQYLTAGASEGRDALWGFIVGGIGMMIGIGALIVNWRRSTDRSEAR